jgi:hypothetical protein
MEKNSLKYTGLLVFIVWGALLLMQWLPSIAVGEHTLRRVDLLGDVRRPKPVTEEEPDSLLPPPPKVKPAFVDTCRAGMTCIEDYSDSTMRGMTRFYQALDELAKAPRPVRIAYFGDSFIEADILTADLREMLQQKYGGCGVGFVTITSMTSGFRPTVRHSFSGWESHSVMDSVFFDRSNLGVSGHYFIPYSMISPKIKCRVRNKSSTTPGCWNHLETTSIVLSGLPKRTSSAWLSATLRSVKVARRRCSKLAHVAWV